MLHFPRDFACLEQAFYLKDSLYFLDQILVIDKFQFFAKIWKKSFSQEMQLFVGSGYFEFSDSFRNFITNFG